MQGERWRLTRTAASAARAVTAVCVVVSVVLTGCTSTNPTSSGATSSARPPIPPAAFRDHTGVTPTSVTVANISTLTGGLFKGALVGTQAYAAFINSQGGVNGRKLVVQSYDDQFTGALNKQATEAALGRAFALVGGTTLEDSFGETVLAANPQFANVSESLAPTTQKLENTFSAEPTAQGWPLGPLIYFKDKYPKQILHTGTIVADLPSTIDTWNNEHATMDHIGYKVLYDPSLPPSTSDFTANVVAMKNAGVEILFLEQEPENYASAVIRDLNQQNFHPVVVLGAPAYSQLLVADSGGPSAIDGAYLEQAESLYLGGDQSVIPAVGRFNTWVHAVAPGFTPDFFTLLGWLSGELFTQALRNAGADPSRGSLLQALRHITGFTSGNLIPVTNPAGHVPVSCYLLGRITDGTFQRLDDPPVSGPTNGFRCDQPYYYP